MSASTKANPAPFHMGSENGPFAKDFGAPGVSLQLLQADIEGGFFVVRIRFAPGVELPPHKHTGAVYAFTLCGEWSYLEHTETPPNRAGSYLYEPPGATHTLKVADHVQGDTDVFFVIQGAMLVLDANDQVIAVLDAASHAKDWPLALQQQGIAVPATIPRRA